MLTTPRLFPVASMSWTRGTRISRLARGPSLIDIHDYEVKMKAVRRFFEEGDKVKLTLRFRGREMAHMELGMQLLNKVREEVAPIAKVEAEPKLEGRQMMMVLSPR